MAAGRLVAYDMESCIQNGRKTRFLTQRQGFCSKENALCVSALSHVEPFNVMVVSLPLQGHKEPSVLTKSHASV